MRFFQTFKMGLERSLAWATRFRPMTPGDPHPPETPLRSVDLIQALPAAIYTCDPEGYIQSFNSAAAELWGRS